ncbi:MAG TPA: metallophosphoesterase [Thermoanaerobacterales bacterium]|nr:metallophosphoesterase [Thermoanaerobacterales bacterium]
MKCQFLHVSDIHYLVDYSKSSCFYAGIFKELTPPEVQIQSLIKHIDFTNIDFILISGDLTENGDFSDYKQLKVLLEEIFKNTPMIVTPGNHDDIKAFKQGWLGIDADDSAYNVLVKESGVNIISLDSSSVNYPNGIISEADCEWLEQAIIASKSEPTILVTHHHLLDSQFSMPRAYYTEKFVRLIGDSNIIAIFNGHTHHFYSGEFAGKPYYTADSVSFSTELYCDNNVYFVQRSGLTFCSLENGKLTAKRISGTKTTKRFGVFIGQSSINAGHLKKRFISTEQNEKIVLKEQKDFLKPKKR